MGGNWIWVWVRAMPVSGFAEAWGEAGEWGVMLKYSNTEVREERVKGCRLRSLIMRSKLPPTTNHFHNIIIYPVNWLKKLERNNNKEKPCWDAHERGGEPSKGEENSPRFPSPFTFQRNPYKRVLVGVVVSTVQMRRGCMWSREGLLASTPCIILTPALLPSDAPKKISSSYYPSCITEMHPYPVPASRCIILSIGWSRLSISRHQLSFYQVARGSNLQSEPEKSAPGSDTLGSHHPRFNLRHSFFVAFPTELYHWI